MKHLFATTAIAALVALPLAAQQAGQTGQTGQMQQGGQTGQMQQGAGQMTIQASDLIGKRLYIQREGAEQQSGMMQGQTGDSQSAETQAGTSGQTMQGQGGQSGQSGAGTDTAQTGSGQQGTSGEATQGQTGETETAQTQQGTSGQAAQGQTGETQTAQTQQGTSGEATQGQTGETQMAEMPMGQDMRQGIAEVPDSWTMAGEIDDVLLSQDGRVQALVVDAGGFLGMGETSRRVDIQDVRFVPDSDDQGEFFMVYSGSRQDLEGTERFEEATARNEIRGSEVWGTQDTALADVGYDAIVSDDLIGTAVYGSNDEWVGEISEIALNDSGEIDQIIVDVGGFLGLGEKPVAMTMDQIRLRSAGADNLRAYVNATQAELESMEEWGG